MLLDTSGLLCFLHKAEIHHLQAVRHFSEASIRLTHNYVLAELVALSRVRRFPRQPVLEFIAELHNSSAVQVVFVDSELHLAALELLRRRLDKTWSLCDAVSFLLMESQGIHEALTTDHHFEQAGFIRLLQP